MGIFSKQKIAVAASNRSKIDLSCNHITTGNWMELQPFNYRHMIPGEHFKGSVNCVSRLAPVAVPCYGRCRINMRAFFVPFSFVMPQFEEMVTDTVGVNYSSSSLVSSTPYFLLSELVKLFELYQVSGAYPLAQTTNGSIYDFVDGSTKFLFTSYGRRFYKVLQSLGYQLFPDTKYTGQKKLSALALLSYAKVYLDYYSNHAYANTATYLAIRKLFSYNDPTTPLVLDYNNIGDLISTCYIVSYDEGHDVYTNAWDHPIMPASGNYSTGVVSDASQDGYGQSATISYGSLAGHGTPMMLAANASTVNIGTQYIHDMLQSMTDFFKRNQLSGSYAAERFLSRYGFSLDNQQTKRAYYVAGSSVDVDFGSVMQTADTSPAGSPSNLGDYAGVGFGKGNLEVDFEAREFGLLMFVYSIVPAASLYQGLDRNNLHLTMFDFFNPEFDNLGCDAINRAEVYVSRDFNFAFSGSMDEYFKVFGFAPRYYEYKQARDFVTGDFVCDSAMVGGDAWFLNRKFNDNSFAASNTNGVIHSLAFTSGVDKDQYDRIFQYTDQDVDKFYLVFHTDGMSLAPCRSLFDTYDFEDAGRVITQNGNSAPVN